MFPQAELDKNMTPTKTPGAAALLGTSGAEHIFRRGGEIRSFCMIKIVVL